ncbi:MAG: sugar ABC transporter ATP-binding protein [Rhizobiaceae bacterium]
MNSDEPGKPAIRAEGIGVSFAGVSVLRDVTLDILPGEIHGLVGENGAGKSTLGKVLGGYYTASQGKMEVFGRAAVGWDPHTALANGIAMMHQELQLVPALTVAQNVFLGIEEHQWGVLRTSEAARLEELMKSSGFSLDPHAVVSELSIADQQKIEILRALARDAKVIVMDEPTSSLSKSEVDQLHDSMRNLRAEGRTVIYVSHFLDDILAVTDRITVLRDGDHVMTAATEGLSKSDLVASMLGGGKTETPYPEKSPPKTSEIVLEARHLSSAAGAQDATLTIGRGEIVGLIGLVGSGRSEIVRAIIGADASTSGELVLDGEPYTDRTVAKSNERGLVMVPEDRRKQGLIMTMPVRANMSLPHLKNLSSYGVVKSTDERKRAVELIDHFQVRPAAVDGDVSNYSGGNQQKVLIGKWLMESPRVVILDEPSRGVDVGARQRIHEAIAELAASGAAILLVSSEIDEVLGLAHRAYLIDRGSIVEEIDPSENDEASVLSALFHHQSANHAKSLNESSE